MSRKRKSNESEESQPETGTIKHQVTHDFVLDIYERGLQEKDERARKAILATADILSRRIGEYLVDTKK